MRPPLIPQTVLVNDNDLEHVKILKQLYNHLIEYREPKTGRIIIAIFMCLPSRKDFPEYFDIIQRPISMYEIRKRIENGVYKTEDPCLEDFKLMFNNCRTFNEDGSIIYLDSLKLEDMLMRKYDQLVPDNNRHKMVIDTTSPTKFSPSATSSSSNNLFAHHNSATTTTTTTSTPIRRAADKYNNHNNGSQHTPTPGSKKNKNSNTSNNIYHQNNNNTNNQHPPNHSTPFHHGHQQQRNHQFSQSSNNLVMNGLTSDADSNSNSNHFSSCNGNTQDSFIIDHNFHNDASIDSNSNLSIGLNATSASTASINGSSTGTTITTTTTTKRHKKGPDRPKRNLTGYIIFAAEVRKEYVDKHPNQDFGFVSKLIGDDWKALPKDLKLKYHNRAMAHNEKMERAKQQQNLIDGAMTTPDGQPQFSAYNYQNHSQSHYPQYPPNNHNNNHHLNQTPDDNSMTNGTRTPKMTKKRLAKMAREARLHNSSTPFSKYDSSFSTPAHPRMGHHLDQRMADPKTIDYNHQNQRSHPYSTQQGNYGEQNIGRPVKVDSGTQTAPFRFVEPPARRRHAYAETYRRYIESLNVPNVDMLVEETSCSDRPPEPVNTWLGSGIGRHRTTEAALWALRDFMLQDSKTMRMNMQPYLF